MGKNFKKIIKKCSGIILILVVMVGLYITPAIPAVPALAYTYDAEVDPEEGPIGTEVTVVGESWGWSDTYERWVTIYFSDEEADVNDNIGDEVKNYETVVSLADIEEDNDGSFEVIFDIPGTLSDGEDDVDVESGDYFLYFTVTNETATEVSTLIREVVEFTVTGSGDVTININTPDTVPEDTDFTGTVDISFVEELNAAQYDIWFDPTILRLDSIDHGQIDSETIVSMPAELDVGHWRVVNYPVIMTDNVTGSGYLSVLNFHSIGGPSTGSDISIADGILSGLGGEISADWVDDHVDILAAGDANGDGIINVLDMTKTARIILEIDAPTPGADADQDNDVDIFDMTKIARIILELD